MNYLQKRDAVAVKVFTEYNGYNFDEAFTSHELEHIINVMRIYAAAKDAEIERLNKLINGYIEVIKQYEKFINPIKNP